MKRMKHINVTAVLTATRGRSREVNMPECEINKTAQLSHFDLQSNKDTSFAACGVGGRVLQCWIFVKFLKPMLFH